MKFWNVPYSQFIPEFYAQQRQGDTRKTWFSLTPKAEGEKASAELYIYDFIGMFGVEPMAVVEALKAVSGQSLTVRLNSPGGSGFDGVTIYNAIRKHDGGVTVVVDGVAASAASLIAMAGEKIVMNQGSRMMIHDAWGLTMGNADEHLYSADRLNEFSADMAEIYASRTGIGKRTIRQMMKAETWFNAKQAKDQGFADEVDGQATSNDKAEFRVPEGMYKSEAVSFAEGGLIPKMSKYAIYAPKVEVETFLKDIKAKADKAEEILQPSFDLETEQRRLRLASV